MNSVKRRGGGKPNRGGGRGNHRGRPPPPRKTSDPPSQNGAMSRKGIILFSPMFFCEKILKILWFLVQKWL